jgi:DNA mismatch endonuclease, patch repair protein
MKNQSVAAKPEKIRTSNRRKDHLSVEERSLLMSKIRGKGTTPELAMAKLLRKLNIKFRRHRKDLPGTPDFVLIEFHITLFVEGDFWHGRNFKKWGNRLLPYWRTKIINNIRRDRNTFRKLRRRGWTVLRIWESEMKKNLDKCELRLEKAINKE